MAPDPSPTPPPTEPDPWWECPNLVCGIYNEPERRLCVFCQTHKPVTS